MTDVMVSQWLVNISNRALGVSRLLDDWPPWLPGLMVSVVILLIASGLAAWALVVLRETVDQREDATLQAIMQATLMRQDLRVWLGALLQVSVEQLHAMSGTVHLALGREADYELVGTEHVALSHLAREIPRHDPLVQLLSGLRDHDAFTGRIDPSSPWAALSNGEPYTLGALQVGLTTFSVCLVLCWPSRPKAEQQERLMIRLRHYARYALADFDRTNRRLEDLDALDQALRQRDWLSHAVAHDLGGLLGPSVSVLSTLAHGETPQTENAAESLRQMRLATQMLEELVAPDQPIEADLVSLKYLFRMAQAFMDPYDTVCSYSAELPAGLPDVWGDERSIMRVLNNLLRNAVIHNQERQGLKVWLRVEPRGNLLQFEVGDSGQGIASEVQPHIFRFGYQSDAAKTTKGRGIGLWSCQRLVMAHGGRIWFETTPGKGTRFYFTLPAATGANRMSA